jgi:hypothetical protein
MKLEILLRLAAVAHIGLLCAGVSMPLAVKMREHLKQLPPFLRQLFWTYYAFIGLCILGFGSFTFFYAKEIASGAPATQALCGFLSVFWTLRLFVAGFVFNMKPYLTNGYLKAGYLTLNLLFFYLIAVYTTAAINPRFL